MWWKAKVQWQAHMWVGIVLLVGFVSTGVTVQVAAWEELPQQQARDAISAKGGAQFVAEEATLNLIYDDGAPNDGTRAAFPADIEFAMRFDTVSGADLQQVAVCFQRLFSADSGSGTFVVRVYQATGGGPGSQLGAYQATVSGFPVTGIPGAFRTFGLPSPLPVPSSFYVGVTMDSLTSDLYLCVDHNGAQRPIYASLNGGAWVDYSDVSPEVTKLMVRAQVETQDAPPPPPPPSDDCDAGPDAITLLNGRFQFDVCYETNTGQSGTGKLAFQQGTGATLWFFNSNNPEIFVKVRDACVAPFNRYWIFAAGLTNVEVTITVTDLQSGASETYFNPLGNPFESVQDTDSFATCP